jgi:predicted PhzF superfamily epimerase YddE/YHI9
MFFFPDTSGLLRWPPVLESSNGDTAGNQPAAIFCVQDVEMKRPSQIFVRTEKQADKIHGVHVGGQAVEILHGEFLL